MKRSSSQRQLLKSKPALTKSKLLAKYEQYIRHRFGNHTFTDNAAVSTDDRAGETTPVEDAVDSSSDEEEEVPAQTMSTRFCGLKNILNWAVRWAYLFAIGAILWEMGVHWTPDETKPAESATKFKMAEGCLTGMVIVFATYVIMHNALELTRTEVYGIQVAISVIWTGFLVTLVTASTPCDAIRLHTNTAIDACGLTEHVANLQGFVGDLFLLDRNDTATDQKFLSAS